MNVFFLDNNPKICAEYHCDKHVIKMILESVQILSTVLRVNGVDAGYKATHKNHPATLWAGKSLSNWLWIRELTEALNEEYRFRYEKQQNHKSYDLMLSLPKAPIEDIGFTEVAQVIPEEFRMDDPVEAYRNYYFAEKAAICTWTRRAKPLWWMEKEKINSSL